MALALKADQFRKGSKAALSAPTSNFRFAPDSGLKSDIAPCLKSANRRQHPPRQAYYSWVRLFFVA
jgi:hypothetical protein